MFSWILLTNNWKRWGNVIYFCSFQLTWYVLLEVLNLPGRAWNFWASSSFVTSLCLGHVPSDSMSHLVLISLLTRWGCKKLWTLAFFLKFFCLLNLFYLFYHGAPRLAKQSGIFKYFQLKGAFWQTMTVLGMLTNVMTCLSKRIFCFSLGFKVLFFSKATSCVYSTHATTDGLVWLLCFYFYRFSVGLLQNLQVQ